MGRIVCLQILSKTSICECGSLQVIYYNFECACLSSLIQKNVSVPSDGKRMRNHLTTGEIYNTMESIYPKYVETLDAVLVSPRTSRHCNLRSRAPSEFMQLKWLEHLSTNQKVTVLRLSLIRKRIQNYNIDNCFEIIFETAHFCKYSTTWKSNPNRLVLFSAIFL